MKESRAEVMEFLLSFFLKPHIGSLYTLFTQHPNLLSSEVPERLPGSIMQSVACQTEQSEVLCAIPGPATYFCGN